jgi:hypothetical protein
LKYRTTAELVSTGEIIRPALGEIKVLSENIDLQLVDTTVQDCLKLQSAPTVDRPTKSRPLSATLRRKINYVCAGYWIILLISEEYLLLL